MIDDVFNIGQFVTVSFSHIRFLFQFFWSEDYLEYFQVTRALKDALENYLCPNEIPNAKIQLRLLSELNEHFDIIAENSQKVNSSR